MALKKSCWYFSWSGAVLKVLQGGHIFSAQKSHSHIDQQSSRQPEFQQIFQHHVKIFDDCQLFISHFFAYALSFIFIFSALSMFPTLVFNWKNKPLSHFRKLLHMTSNCQNKFPKHFILEKELKSIYIGQYHVLGKTGQHLSLYSSPR